MDPKAKNKFPNNKVTTTKYTCATFLPKNLLEQFTKMANTYFLLIIILQLIPGLASEFDWVFTLLPLMLVVGVSMVKDAYEDNKRRKKDREENQARVLVCSGGAHEFHETISEDIQVGCLVKVHENENFPCDLILIESDLPRYISFVETKNLDGETNLKQKVAYEATYHHVRASRSAADNQSIFEILQNAEVDCEGPNEFLYRFAGNLTFASGDRFPIDEKQILLKGSTLRNTKWAVGIAVFTGHDTKIMQNSSKSKVKRSKNAKALNYYIMLCMLIQLLCSLAGAIVSTVQTETGEISKAWYLKGGEESEGDSASIQILAKTAIWFITLMNFVPISLLVTLEMINFLQAYFITVDVGVYDTDKALPAVVQSSNLNEELGMVHYIFSDKTGTLTQNIMEFQKFTVGKEKYGEDAPKSIEYAPGVTNVNFYDPKL